MPPGRPQVSQLCLVLARRRRRMSDPQLEGGVGRHVRRVRAAAFPLVTSARHHAPPHVAIHVHTHIRLIQSITIPEQQPRSQLLWPRGRLQRLHPREALAPLFGTDCKLPSLVHLHSRGWSRVGCIVRGGRSPCTGTGSCAAQGKSVGTPSRHDARTLLAEPQTLPPHRRTRQTHHPAGGCIPAQRSHAQIKQPSSPRVWSDGHGHLRSHLGADARTPGSATLMQQGPQGYRPPMSGNPSPGE